MVSPSHSYNIIKLILSRCCILQTFYYNKYYTIVKVFLNIMVRFIRRYHFFHLFYDRIRVLQGD